MNKFVRHFLFFIIFNLIFSMLAVAMDSSASDQCSFGPPGAITSNEMQLLLTVQRAQLGDDEAFEEVRRLLDMSTNPNIVVEGQSPLLGAVLNENIRMIYLLKSYGARAGLSLDSEGRTVVNIAEDMVANFVLSDLKKNELMTIMLKAISANQTTSAREAE